MGDEWPDWGKIEELVKGERFMAGNEVFITFNKKVLKSSLGEIAEQASHAEPAWRFLIGFAGCKKMYRSKILQVFNKLMQVPSWVTVWEAQSASLGEQLKGLHEDLQAALAVQSPVLMKSVSPAVMQSIKQVKAEEQPEEVGKGMERDRLVDEIQKEAGPSTPAFSNEAVAEEPAEPAELVALQDGIDGVMALSGNSSGSRETLNRLRIGCIQCAGHEAHFQQECKHAPDVLGFLLSYAAREPGQVHLVAEVMNPIMASPSWSAVLEASPILQESLRELPVDAQAALGLQHEALMRLISPEGRQKATGGEVPDNVKGVADRMRSIRRAPEAAARAAPEPAPSAEAQAGSWKEARTPEGHVYYYNTKTRESTWERPASLGGPRIWRVGDAVEVWSNSQKKWGRGVVERVEGESVVAEFTLPGGSVAKKELPAAHKDLRPAQGAFWPADEEAAYRALFGGDATKGTPVVVELLRRSGLNDRVLGQVWMVANPGSKADLGFEEFAKCCRLVAHCQAMAGDPLLARAERPLRVKLREECLGAQPPALPSFS